jgi:nicotinamidase-related amidase
MFDRKGSLTLQGFRGSGADWMEQYKPYIEDGQTVFVSLLKVYGPETNDLVLQPRKRGIGRVILAGMADNACIESHMRERPEQGFEVAVVHDTTVAPQVPDGEGYQVAFGEFPIPCERRLAD